MTTRAELPHPECVTLALKNGTVDARERTLELRQRLHDMAVRVRRLETALVGLRGRLDERTDEEWVEDMLAMIEAGDHSERSASSGSWGPRSDLLGPFSGGGQ